MILNEQWSSFLDEELNSSNFKNLQHFLKQEYKLKTIFPNYADIFRAFNLITPLDVKVVIIGQDPYHGINQANGLAFSVYKQCKIPPSLKNIFKELVDDLGCDYPLNGDLIKWSGEGVFLINSVLSVEEANANSHKDKGWEIFTDSIIKKLSYTFENIVFILWGNQSQKKEVLIDTKKHSVLKSSHPSPLSSYRGFFGSKPFSKSNRYLKEHNKKEIDWCLNVQQTLL